MSSACDTCDCPDKTNCPKKRNGFGVEIVAKNYNMSFELEVAENDCKCGPSCTCTTCTCHSA